MTETDTIEINGLINSMKELKSYCEKVNGKYFDEDIANYASEAKSDYEENKRILKTIVQSNIGLFFDVKNLKVSNTFCDSIKVQRGEKISLEIGEGVSVVVKFTDFNVIRNDGYSMTFDVRGIEVYDIHYHTSNTDDIRYNTCSAWDLVDYPRDNEAKIPFYYKKTASEWKKLLSLANWTREKNSLLVKQFKLALSSKIKEFHDFANLNEKIIENIKGNFVKYVKVDL